MRIEEYEFWKIIESLGWSTVTTDYKLLAEKLDNSGYDVRLLHKIFAQYKVDLKYVITRWEDLNNKYLGIGDDSFDDLVSHIIGLGRAEYEKVYADPSHAFDRANNPYNTKGGYTESFAYIFY